MRRWFMWIPVLMVASLLFWTVALALGGMSLMAANKLSLAEAHRGCPYEQAETAVEDTVRSGYDPIVVRIQESADPEDVGAPAEPVPGLDQAPVAPPSAGPGRTAF